MSSHSRQPSSFARFLSLSVSSRRFMSMYGWLCTRLSAQLPNPTRVFGTISVTTAPLPPPQPGASGSQYVYVAASPSTAALRMNSCISEGSRLCSNSASN